MKKKLFGVILLAAITLFSCFAGYADNAVTSGYRVTPIPSIRIKVDMSQLTAGTEFDIDASAIVSVPDNSYYFLNNAEWVAQKRVLSIGDTPQIKVYLNALPKEVSHEKYDQIWLFNGGYGSGNATVVRGTLVSTQIRESGYALEVILQTDPITGTYSMPENPMWTDQTGTAKWTAGENTSGLFDVLCYRDGTVVKRLNSYSGTAYNFYPYMTKPGSYSFQVRTAVPEEFKNSSVHASEYSYSPSIYVREDMVSDGSGQTHDDEKGGGQGNGNSYYPNGTGNEKVAGWFTDGTGTYFRYPDGSYLKNSWLNLNGQWYRMDSMGRRVSGWFRSPESKHWFYLDPQTGVMRTGWLQLDGHWYYLNPTKDGSEGSMLTKWQKVGNEWYYFNESGIMVTGWYQIDGHWYYFYPEGSRSDGKFGAMARNVKIGEFMVGPDGYWIV